MTAGLAIEDLLQYTDWERGKWLDWFRPRAPRALQISAGPHGDNRFQTVGEVIRHIFSAEKRYIDRLSGHSLTDTAAIPADNIEALFRFGRQSRSDLRDYIANLPTGQWDALLEFQMFNAFISATARKIVAHILLHEIRHWAQIATMLRLQGLPGEFHDLLFSPVLGGEFRRGT